MRLPYWIVPPPYPAAVYRPRFVGQCKHGEDRCVNVCPSCDAAPWERAWRAIRRREWPRRYYVAFLVPRAWQQRAGCKAWARFGPRPARWAANVWNWLVTAL